MSGEKSTPAPRRPKFVLTDRAVLESVAPKNTYSIYNYYGRGPIARAKRRRFQKALDLAAGVTTRGVIDMGTADGVFLPTLAAHYERVVAVDLRPDYAALVQRLVDSLPLTNIRVICSDGLTVSELKAAIGPGFGLMYLLETLEHVGAQPDMWAGKVEFLHGCFALLEPGGRIVISVPKMVGLVMIFKNLLQRSLGLGHDSLTWRQLLRSGLLKKTDDLEPLWANNHIGFNHIKLDKLLEKHFVIHRRAESLISVFYVIGARTEAKPIEVPSAAVSNPKK